MVLANETAHRVGSVAVDVSLSRFKQSLLGLSHDKERAVERAAELDKALLEQTAATKNAHSELAELQSRFDEAICSQEEAQRKVQSERKAVEDERTRHTLHSRLAVEKATEQQAKLQ
jgi:UDP-3-O-[3-hydroxymyristoyl] glucosamine N-acyltransferase